MPTISLRMTDEQLEELREWARVGNRSMQREIIWRLFSADGQFAPKYAPATEEPREAVEELPDVKASVRVIPQAEADNLVKPDAPPDNPSYRHERDGSIADDDHFKPDFGSKLK